MKNFAQKLKKNSLISLLIKLWKHPKGRLGLIIVAILAVVEMVVLALSVLLCHLVYRRH